MRHLLSLNRTFYGIETLLVLRRLLMVVCLNRTIKTEGWDTQACHH